MRVPDDLLHLQRSQGGDERHQLCSRIALLSDDKGQIQVQSWTGPRLLNV